jgi:glycosyltransferase involved in cell wall biosynthesis
MLSQKKMRIAHIITRMDRGGAPDVVRILMEQTDPQIIETVLYYGLTDEPSGRIREFIQRLGPRARLIPSLRRNIHPFFDLITFYRLRRIFKEEKFDIVHTHTSKAGFLGRCAARSAGVLSIVHSPHGHVFYGYFHSFLSGLIVIAEKMASQFCERIHVLTELEKKDMVNLKIAPENKIVTIYSGLALDEFRKNNGSARAVRASLGISDEALVVGFAGRLEPVKGPEFFIRAAAIVRHLVPGARFLVVGDGSLRPSLEEEAGRLGIADAVHFVGWQDDVNSFYGAMDILLLSSLNEAVGRSILEAQAVGVAVVATRVGGVPEIIQDGVTGILVPPHDAEALARATEKLLTDSALRASLTKAGRERVEKLFSDRAMVKRFEELYKGLVEGRRKRDDG